MRSSIGTVSILCYPNHHMHARAATKLQAGSPHRNRRVDDDAVVLFVSAHADIFLSPGC